MNQTTYPWSCSFGWDQACSSYSGEVVCCGGLLRTVRPGGEFSDFVAASFQRKTRWPSRFSERERLCHVSAGCCVALGPPKFEIVLSLFQETRLPADLPPRN